MGNEDPTRLSDELKLQDILRRLDSLQDQFYELAPRLHGAEIDRQSIRINDNEIEKLARLELKRRNLRFEFFPAELFGESGWNILLDLFVHEREGKRVSVTSACLASQAPATTALRYIKFLESLDLVIREDDPDDHRRTYLRLTSESRDKITKFLSATSDLELESATQIGKNKPA